MHEYVFQSRNDLLDSRVMKTMRRKKLLNAGNIHNCVLNRDMERRPERRNVAHTVGSLQDGKQRPRVVAFNEHDIALDRSALELAR